MAAVPTEVQMPRRHSSTSDSRRKVLRILGAVALVAGLLTASASPAVAATHTVTFDRCSLSVDGQRTMLWSGEFHPYRLPSPDLWRDVLQKMKASGFNAVSVYFDWGYHSPRRGV